MEMPPENSTPHPEQDSAVPRKNLSGIGKLFARTWNVYTKRILSLIGIQIIPGIVIFVFVLCSLPVLFLLKQNLLLFTGLSILGMIAIIILILWEQTAFICAVSDETLGIKAAFGQAKPKINSFLWIGGLSAFIVTGGFFLLIIPGILFAVWFSFAVFIFIKEDERGLNAILKSKEYVRGYFGPVFLRFFIIGVLFVVISLIPFVGSFLSLFFTPFAMLYSFLLYEELKTLKGDSQYTFTAKQRIFWMGTGTLGSLIPLIIVALIALPVIFSKKPQSFQSLQSIHSVFSGITKNFIKNPNTISIKKHQGISPRQDFPQRNLTAQDRLRIKGIAQGNGAALSALINDEVVEVGDKIEGVTVQKIEMNSVTFITETGTVFKKRVHEE